MRRLAFVLLILTVLTAGCGDDKTSVATSTTGATTSSQTTPTSSSTTTAAVTTTATTTATTTTPLTYQVDPSHLFPSVFPGVTNGAHGSGCVTPGFDQLPDGVWFGFASSIRLGPRSAAGGTITFDLACFFTGSVACDAQIEDGGASSRNDCLDFWIRNNVATTFAVPISPTARVWYIDALAPEWEAHSEIPLASWPTGASFQICPGEYCAVWLYVNGGEATGIVEQYLP